MSRMIEEDLNDLDTLTLIDLRMLSTLSLSIGQRALLQSAAATLKSKHNLEMIRYDNKSIDICG